MVIPENVDMGPETGHGIIEWLDKNIGNRVIYLPVEIDGQPLIIKSTHLISRQGGIEIRLDTGALSLDLPMHLMSICQAYPCRLWLQGTWGPIVSRSMPTGKPVFAVRKVGGVFETETPRVLLMR
ncbi:hypothetical protein ABMY26_34710 [Azospirillum sp. HJ39]|uniref:hypothetical protein n=1 Tax=Azospirillum sp. HJ39 TaxID=3159496 RepID=UPI003556E196